MKSTFIHRPCCRRTSMSVGLTAFGAGLVMGTLFPAGFTVFVIGLILIALGAIITR